MKPIILIALVLGAASQLAAGAAAPAKLDANAVAGAFRDFLTELETNMATWHDQAQKIRQVVQTRMNTPTGTTAPVRRLLTTDPGAKLDAAKALLSKSWDLVLDAGSAVRHVVSLGATRVQDFFADVLGPTWRDWVPPAWLDPDFSWDDLIKFDFHSNLKDFLHSDAMSGLLRPQSVGELYSSMEAAVAAYCTPGSYVEGGDKIPTSCTGPYLQLAFEPKICVVDDAAKEVVCDPAKLVLYKYPGECTLKYHSAASWTGKECRLRMKMGGEDFSRTHGGDGHHVDMEDFLAHMHRTTQDN